MGKPIGNALELPHLASGPTPPSGKSNVFVKSDGKVYVRQPSTAEAALSTEGHTHAVTDMTATGTRSSTTFLRGDNTWAAPTGTTYSEITTAEIDAGTAATLRTITGRRMQYLRDFLLSKAANLSDLANAATARVNLGLGNVDNTSDANKPVSTAQQTALNGKADYAVITPIDSWAAPNTYPYGTSMFGVGSSAGTLDTGWPVGAKPCSVVTERASKTAMTGNDYEWVTQRCMDRTSIETYYRTASNSTTWTPWSKVYVEGQMKQPYSKRWKTGNQQISSGSGGTTVTFGNPTEFDISYSSGDWTITKAGLYLFTVSLDWDRPNTTNRRELRFQVNSVQVALQSQPATALDAQNATQTLTYMNLMNVGDVFRAIAWQNSGSTVAVIGSETTTFAAITRLSDKHV